MNHPSSDEDIARARRVCFFAHYHPHGIAAPHVLLYLAALRDAGFAVVVLSTATMDETERAKLAAACARLILRANHGLDFGGWIDACRGFFPLSAEFLLLANDSVYAPFHDLAAFIDRLTAVPADFYGAVESHEDGPHLQSWFLLLRPSAYDSPAFRQLMGTSIPADMSKPDIIATYERGLTRSLTAAGLRYHAAYSPSTKGRFMRERRLNPAHFLWRPLIENERLPFLKIELLRDNPLRFGDTAAWRQVADRRNRPLATAIADDLNRRGLPPESTGDRWRWSLEVDRSEYWPELRGFLLRDHRYRGWLTRTINDSTFALAERFAKRARRFLRNRGLFGRRPGAR